MDTHWPNEQTKAVAVNLASDPHYGICYELANRSDDAGEAAVRIEDYYCGGAIKAMIPEVRLVAVDWKSIAEKFQDI